MNYDAIEEKWPESCLLLMVPNGISFHLHLNSDDQSDVKWNDKNTMRVCDFDMSSVSWTALVLSFRFYVDYTISVYAFLAFSYFLSLNLYLSISCLLLSFSCCLLCRYQPKFNIIVTIAMKSFAMLCNSSFVFASSFYALCNGYSSKSISYLSIFHIQECFYLKIYWQFVIIVIQPLSSAMQRIAWIIN